MPGLTTTMNASGESDASTVSSPNVTSGSPPPSGRRSSGRVRAKPATYDASPQISVEKFVKMAGMAVETSPSKQFKSYPMRQRLAKDSPESSPDAGVFKKPAPIVKPKATKGPLSITIKKGKVASVKKTVTSRSSIGGEKSLFSIVRDGRSAVQSVINDWIESYNSDKTQAMTELIQFFVQCSGCNAVVTRDMVEAEDTVTAIRHLTENFGEEAEEYPLIITKPDYKKFKSNFVAFVLQLVNLCQHNIIYDEEMMDILICWIIGLTDSPVRAFRHTSTLAGMKIVTGLIDVANKVSNEFENTERQLSTEEEKQTKQKSREKIERLGRRKEELKQNKSELEDMVNRLFQSIFIHRYRDSRPEIRLICISEMGEWMSSYSSYFLDQNYLKYLGWTLYDKVGDVRLGVLRALERLYTNEEFLEHLELFTSRFKDRLIHMTLDVEAEVAVQAIRIASLLYKYDALEEEDCSQVEQLVFCDQRRMAHAAGEFLALRIIRLSIEASPQKMIRAKKSDYLRQMNIKAILDFFIKTEIHDHCAYLIDSLWEHTNLLKDWKTMTTLLLDSNPLIELEDIEESALIDLMCCACKQAATAQPPPGRIVNKKLSNKDKIQHEQDRIDISIHFMEHLPSLLMKYKADVVKVRDLLTIPQFFNLEIYPEKRLTKHLDDLLSHMEDIVLKHADTELLEVCSQTYYYLIDNDVVIKQAVEVSRNRLIDQIVKKFRNTIVDGIPNAEEDREGELFFNFVTGLKRLNAFYRNHDLSEWNIYDDVSAIIDQGVNGSVDDEVLVLSVHIVYMSLLMNLSSLDPDTEPDKAELKQIRRRQKKFVKVMDELLQFGSVPVQGEVFKVLCDFFVYFAKQLLNKAPYFAPIVCEADASLQVRMRDFITTNVFNTINDDDEVDDEEDDSKAQELYNKRTLLCGMCKLIGFRMFDMKLAAPIYAQFLKAYAHYSDIIKQLMQKAKEGDIIAFSRVLLFALQQTFESLRADSEDDIDTRSTEFMALKDLAKRFALFLGVNMNADSTRKSTITIHRDGINYAFRYPADISPEKEAGPPPNLLFLEILHEFTYRLIKVDRKVVMAHLEKTAGNLLHKKGQSWQPVRMYKNGVSTGTSETKLTDDSSLMEDVPVGGKPKTISFANSKRPVGDRNKAKKKLSMSSAGAKKKEPSPKVAKGIPKAPTRKSSRANRAATYEEAPDIEEEEEDSDDDEEEMEEEIEEEMEEEEEDQESEREEQEQEGLKMKMVVKRTSPESWMVSPAKPPSTTDSPRKQYSQRSRTSISQPVTITQSTPTKNTPTKSPAKSPTKSPSKKAQPQTPESSPRKRGRPPKSPPTTSPRKRKMDDADSTIGSESGFADSIHNSPSQGTPAKKSKYSMRSGNTPTKLAEKIYLENLRYATTASATESREERLAKRRSRQDAESTPSSTPQSSQQELSSSS